MRIWKRSLSLIIILSFMGCVPVYRVPLFSSMADLYSRVPIGVEQIATTGEAFYVSPMKMVTCPAFYVNQDFQPPNIALTSFPLVQKGTVLICKFTVSGQKDMANPDVYLCEKEFGDLGRPMNLDKPTFVEYYLIVSNDGTPIGALLGSWDAYWDKPRQKFDVLKDYKTPIIAKDTLKYELIYNGKSGDTIKVSYREFLGDMARPAFTQDLNYDLSESKVIAFKSVIIEILEATSSTIKYKLIKN